MSTAWHVIPANRNNISGSYRLRVDTDRSWFPGGTLVEVEPLRSTPTPAEGAGKVGAEAVRVTGRPWTGTAEVFVILTVAEWREFEDITRAVAVFR